MYAVRCKEYHTHFRRSGILFPGNAWILLETVTPEQLAEPALLVLEVSGEDDPKLIEALVVPPVPDPAPTSDATVSPAIDAVTEAALRAEIEQLKAQILDLHDSLTLYHAANEAIGTERDSLKAELDALKASVPTTPVESTPEVTPVADAPVAKESKAGKANA